MYLDQHALPMQADGDRNDQLQRVGMILTAFALHPPGKVNDDLWNCTYACHAEIKLRLQPGPGVYVRYIGGDISNVSADQLIPILATHVARRDAKEVAKMALACVRRLGFAQNYKDGLNGQDRTKVPDFLALRALPLFARASGWLYPLAALSDLLLVFAAIASVGPVFRDDSFKPTKRGPDDVDDNCIITTLVTCNAVMPTPLSKLAAKIYSKLRPWNYGCRELRQDNRTDFLPDAYPPVYGALRWYHRKESGGNPEIADLWEPLIARYLS